MKHCLFNKVKHVHQCNLKPIAAIQHSIIVIIEPYSVVDPDPSSSLVDSDPSSSAVVDPDPSSSVVFDPDPSSSVAQLSICSRGTSTVMGWPNSINPEF